MGFNILRNATIRNAIHCANNDSTGFEVVWRENDNFEQYEEVSGITSSVVWDRTFSTVATSGTCYLGPSTPQAPVDAAQYNIVRIKYRVNLDNVTIAAPTTGRIQFQTADDPVYDSVKIKDFTITSDNAYHEYVLDMSQVKPWVGQITRIRLYPFIDGSIGTKIHLKYIKVQSDSLSGCNHVVGAGGKCTSTVVADGINIVANVNDKLVININGYGNQGVTLTPIVGARLSNIARDIEDKLSNIAIGGYAGAIVEATLGKLSIIADDTREALSSVVVEDTAAARTLGFYNSTGVDISICILGEDSGIGYRPAGSIRLSRGEISHLFLEDPSLNKSGIEITVGKYTVQAGREDYDLVYPDTKLDFTGDTLIDFNNPVSNNGTITFISYSGDGNTTTEFRVYRPKADGSIQFINFASMGVAAPVVDKIVSATVSIKVRKGDFIGLFDGKIHLGKIDLIANSSYFLYDGDLQTTSPILPITSRGERGLRMFARGSQLAEDVVLDIDFDNTQLIEQITVTAEEEVREEVINLSRARAGGPNSGPLITGSTGLDKLGAQAPALVNLAALTDSIYRAETSATPTMHPSWLDGVIDPVDLYDQTDFIVRFDYAKGIPVFFNIFKVVLYFRDEDNIKYFGIEYPITTDETDTNISWGTFPRYTDVEIEGKQLTPTDHPLYDNPIVPTADNFIDSYQLLQYRTLSLEFEPIRARSLRYVAKNFSFEDDVSKSTLSDFVVAPSAHIIEMDVFAVSKPVAAITDNFFFESSQDRVKYYLHTVVEEVGSTSGKYLIGYPVKHLRLHITPEARLNIKSIEASLSESKSLIKTNTFDGTVNHNVPLGDFSTTSKVTITNDFDREFNYYIDIANQVNNFEKCILWNRMSGEDAISKSEIGPSPALFKQEDSNLREYNYAYLAPAYIVDPLWLLNNNAVSYITYDNGSSFVSIGSMVTNYTKADYITSHSTVSGFTSVFIFIDLGKVYSIDTIQVIAPVGFLSVFGTTYSNKDVSNVEDLDIFNDFFGSKQQARWVRLTGLSKSVGNPSADTHALAYLRISLDVRNLVNNRKVPWVASPRLTNFGFGTIVSNGCGEGWHCGTTGFTNYYAVDLEYRYNVTNVITGPSFDTLALVNDIDLISPGGPSSLFIVGSTNNTNLSFSGSDTSDPNKVAWSSFDDTAGGLDRWLLLRNVSSLYDEVDVHIEGNVQDDKPSFDQPRWWTSRYGTITKDIFDFKEGLSSLSIDYDSDLGPAQELIEIIQSFGHDHSLSKRDSLRFWFYISDVSQLDITTGSFSIGRNTTEANNSRAPLALVTKDEENYFIWQFSSLSFVNGWNEMMLPFTDDFKVGEPYFTRDDNSLRSSTDLSGKSRFRWFRVNYQGVQSNDEFTIKVNGFSVKRGKFVPAKFGDGIYLSGTDYARFPLNNFNVFKGTVEFWLNTDWFKLPGCDNCQDGRDHTIFRFYNSDGYSFSCFMTGKGLRLYITDGVKGRYYLTDASASQILRNTNVHFAVVWDLLGENSLDGMQIYINNVLSSTFEAAGFENQNFKANSMVNLLLGHKAWEGVINFDASSVDAVVSEIKVYNYAIRDFSNSLISSELIQPKTTNELIEISVDGINFFGNQDRGSGLPLLVSGVGVGESFEVDIRNKNTGTLPDKGQPRTSYLEIVRAEV